MFKAGKPDQIKWGDGNWIFWDVGFAQTDNPSSGLLIGGGEPECYPFAFSTGKIVEHIRAHSPTNLVIEAPLSVCFDKHGNPAGRSIEIRIIGGKKVPRYWWQACGIMVGAMYLIRAVAEASPKSQVRLFEGFISYKGKGTTNHRADVGWLRDVVRQPENFEHRIVSRDVLQGNADKIVSAFEVCGFDCGVPAVIEHCVTK